MPRSDANYGAWWTLCTSIRIVRSWLLALKSLSGRSLPEPRPGAIPSDRADSYIIYQIEQAFRRPGGSGHFGPSGYRDRGGDGRVAFLFGLGNVATLSILLGVPT